MDQSKLKALVFGKLSWIRLMRSTILIYLFFALYVYFRADSMIFQPQSASYQDDENILKLPITETKSISAQYLSNSNAEYTVLYSHGNAEDLGDIQPIVERLNRWGFNVLAYDYQGYGTSHGNPSERNAYKDIETAYQYLTQDLRINPSKILVYGRSVGGGPSVELATRYTIAGLILESTFTSAFRVVVPIPILPFDKFSNAAKLSRVNCPVLVLHGEADRVIPFHHGQKLFDLASDPKQFLWESEAGHNDFTWVSDHNHELALLSFQALVKKQEK